MIRAALRAALPAMLLALAVLLPFWNKPFTTDDYVFLREAGQALVTPLQPTSVPLTWGEDLVASASKIVPTGPVIAWLLTPVALAGYSEWVGHAIVFSLFLLAILVTALFALRVGCGPPQASMAALLVAASPVALAMSGTLMPDIPSLLLAVLALERLIAWRDDQLIRDGIIAGLLLGLAILTRTHLLLLLPVGALLVYRRLLPIWIGAGIALLGFWLARDLSGGSLNSTALSYAALQHVHQNLKAFFANWALATPLVAVWLLYTWRSKWTWCVAVAAVAIALECLLRGLIWYPVPLAIVGFGMLADLGWRAWQSHRPELISLFACLWIALPVVLYVHMPSKYLLPSLPAAAVLLVILLPVPEVSGISWVAAPTLAGFVAGALMLYADTSAGRTNQAIVREHIAPRVARREHVWSVGHWGYQWYAERAGARTAALNQMPGKNEIIVVNSEAGCRLMEQFSNGVRVASYTILSYGPHIMNRQLGAGFYSNEYGILPLAWGTSEIRVDLWQLR